MAQVYAAECCCANSAAGLTLLMHIGNSSIESLVHILLAHSTHIYATKLCYTLEDNQNITYHDVKISHKYSWHAARSVVGATSGQGWWHDDHG